MKTTQAWGWLLAGVLAAGLNAVYYDGGAQWAHRAADLVADRSAALLDRASEGADRVVAQAQVVSGNGEAASCRLSEALARFENQIQLTTDRGQAGVDRFVALSDRESTRQQAQMVRLEAARVRMETRIEAQAANIRVATMAFRPVRISPVVCPRVRVNVPRVPLVRVPTPMVRVDLPGMGPV
jgi:cell division protein FtsB